MYTTCGHVIVGPDCRTHPNDRHGVAVHMYPTVQPCKTRSQIFFPSLSVSLQTFEMSVSSKQVTEINSIVADEEFSSAMLSSRIPKR